MKEIYDIKTLIAISIIVLYLGSVCLSGCIDVYERSAVYIVSMSPNGSKLVSRDLEDTIQLWNISSDEEIYRFNWRVTTYLTTGPSSIEWFPDEKRFAVMDGLNIRIYNILNHNELWNASGSSYLDVSQSGRNFATTFGIWNATNYLKINKFNLSSTSPLIDLSSTGNELLYLPSDGDSPEIINVSDGKTIHNLEGISRNLTDMRVYYELGWSSDGEKIALLADYKKGAEGIFLYVWETINYSLLLNKNFPLLGGYADLSPDCTKFIYGNLSKGYISMIDVYSGENIFTLEISELGVSSVDWSEDGSKIAAGSEEGIIKVWNASTGELIQTMMTPKDHRVPT